MIVADSNLIAYLLIPGDQSETAEAVFLKDPAWAAPLLWRSELRNILTLYMRHQGMDRDQAKRIMTQAERIVATNEYTVTSDDVLDCAEKLNITAYDAEFVVLATQLKAALVTSDKALLKAAPAIAIQADQFLDG